MSNKKFFGGLILGASAGAALTLFLSSDKGKKVVADTTTKLQDLVDKLETLVNKGKIKVDKNETKISEA